MIQLRRMPLPSEGGHPLFLPDDYDALTVEGQQLARINACMQWTLRGAGSEEMLGSFQLFHSYYLRDDPDSNFYPGFFDDEPLPFAPFHLDVVAQNAISPLMVVGAPRGSAKSTLLEQIRFLKLVTRPLYSITMCAGGNKLAKRFGARFIIQIDNNSRINDDFGLEFGGRLKPARGRAPFSAEMAYLTNGSRLSHTTTGSFQRGDRPKEFHLDDPEYDPDGESTSMQRLRNELETLLFKSIMPMVTKEDSRLTWLGTTISRAHLLHKALQSEGEGFGHDPRFENWFRIRLKALYRLANGEEASIWPEMWSVEKLKQLRTLWGPAVFRSEMQNDPGTSEGRYFFLDDRHNYTISDPDDNLATNPTESTAKISWTRKSEQITQPLGEFLSQNTVFITLDSAPTATSTSDFNAIAVMAITPFNELFVLDMFNRRVKEHVTALEALRMADKWKASAIGVELHSKSQGIYGSLQHLLGTRAESIETLTHLPSLVPLRVGYAAKTARISSMWYRFGDPSVKDPDSPNYGGLIKFPLSSSLVRTNRDWTALISQIEEFNPEACLAEGTLVVTDRGEIPIETITGEDRVLTREGWKRVRGLHSRGKVPVIRKGPLVGTPDHRVWTENRGWVQLQGLENYDILRTCLRKSESENPLSGTALSTTDILATRISGTDPISAERSTAPSTETCGNTTTDQSPMGCKSITSMEIPETTTSPTWSCSHEPSTTRNILPSSAPSRSVSEEWILQTSTLSALAERNSRVTTTDAFDSAATTASTSTPSSLGEPKKRNGSPSTPETTGRKTTSDCSRTKPNEELERRTVWDLEVEDSHEFFASGILVHNSDGGLENDDAIDTVSMHQDVIKGLRRKPGAQAAPLSTLDLLKSGVTTGRAGELLAHRVDWTQIPTAQRDEILESLRSKAKRPNAPSRI